MTIPQSFPRRTVSTALAEHAPAFSGPEDIVPSAPHWKWRQGSLFLCAGAQLITISALNGSVPVPVVWASLLLAIAPLPLAVLTAFGPVSVARIAAPLGVVVIVAGIAGSVTHAGWVFVPVLLLLLVTTLRLWR
jgi:hypothetical protein